MSGIELKERERLTLCYIHHFMQVNHLKAPPSVREIAVYLNTQLPRKEDREDANIGPQQVTRVVNKLRECGFLLDPKEITEIEGKPRNLMPTDAGLAWIAENCS